MLVHAPTVSLLHARKVPFHVRDEDLGDDWECGDNSWDEAFQSCSVPQERSNDEVDPKLAEVREQRGACMHDARGQ